MSLSFKTALGCTVKVWQAPRHIEARFEKPHTGPGVILAFRMEQEGDGRYAEVVLSRQDIVNLRVALASATPTPLTKPTEEVASPPAPTKPPGILCRLGVHQYPATVNPYTQAPAPIRCMRCGKPMQ